MKSLYIDILIGAIFFAGLLGFAFGEFIISSILFAVAATAANVNINHKRAKPGYLSW